MKRYKALGARSPFNNPVTTGINTIVGDEENKQYEPGNWVVGKWDEVTKKEWD